MLRYINEVDQISKKELIDKLIQNEIINDENVFNYNMDFLTQALCVEKIENEHEIYYKILPGGKVIENF